MAFDTYANLQTAIMLWLARPNDPLLVNSVPDMITLFEAEARRRLRVIGAERTEYLYASGPLLSLPPDFQELPPAAHATWSRPASSTTPPECRCLRQSVRRQSSPVHDPGGWRRVRR
jgi:hypothetical protein